MPEEGNPVAPGPAPRRVLVVEDEQAFAQLLEHLLRQEGYDPSCAANGVEAVKKGEELEPCVVLLDVNLPGRKGPDILEDLHRTHPDLPVVMMTGVGTIELAVECMKRGAYDFLTKPFEFQRLYAVLRNAVQFHELRLHVHRLEGALAHRHSFDEIIAHSRGMGRVVELARRAAQSDSTILILGESGTGKEILARAIHFNSARRNGPFTAINCGAIPEGLLESELFGHEKGAFTGAVGRRSGCFEQAHGGTLFLDEIAEMRPDMQVRLLRALEQREIRRVGSDTTFKVDVRVLSATNQDIRARLREGRFRADLYYRLAILVLELPPLRERREDVGPLALHFLREAQREGQTRASEFAPEAVEALYRYDWPGNAREVRNAVERAMVFEDSHAITLGSLPPEISGLGPPRGAAAPPCPPPARAPGVPEAPEGQAPPPSSASARLPALAPPAAGSDSAAVPRDILSMDEEERKIILRALSLTGGNLSEAARRLGLHRSTLHRKMARYGLATAEEIAAAEALGEGEN